jgi:hypothetical protein
VGGRSKSAIGVIGSRGGVPETLERKAYAMEWPFSRVLNPEPNQYGLDWLIELVRRCHQGDVI